MAIVELVMPKLGESIMEATILKWHKKVGDFVKFDETVLDIATDKVDSEVPSTEQGILTEILFQVNDTVPIGSVIARIQTNADTIIPTTPIIANAPTPKAELVDAPAEIVSEPTQNFYEPAPIPIQQVPYIPAATYDLPSKPIGNRFYSPLVLNIANSEGISLSELERISGTGNDGRVSKRDVLQYVVDRKAGKVSVYQQPTQVSATAPAASITEIVYFEKTTELTANIPEAIVPVVNPVIPPIQPISQAIYERTVIAPIVDEPEPIIAAAPIEQIVPPVSGTSAIITASYQPSSYTGKFSDPASVIITGNTEIIEMDRMRKLIAKHMVDSKHTSPHVTSFTEADVTNMVQWREKIKVEFEKREGTKLTFTPMFMECIAAVIKKFPLVNCSVDGDKVIIKHDINIGMATALPSGNLIVPVIKGADQLNIVGLSKAVNGLADAARNNRLKPEDTTGGTFTLTNVGSFGSLMGTPIIPQPQVAILAVGVIKKRPMVIESATGDTIGIRHMMYLSLSYDHRIVDGSIGASFLTAVAKAFEAWDPNKQWFHYL